MDTVQIIEKSEDKLHSNWFTPGIIHHIKQEQKQLDNAMLKHYGIEPTIWYAHIIS